MSLLNWKPEYSVNKAELDSHHQKMFHILNKVYENVMYSQEVDCTLPIFDELSAITRDHLSAEEQYMREKGVPDIDEHIAKHRKFTHKIETLRTSYHDNNLESSRNLIIVLGEWLLHHVLKEDKKYSDLSLSLEE